MKKTAPPYAKPLRRGTAAIPAHLRRCRACAYTGIALRVVPAHLNQTCLVFSNPASSFARRATEDKPREAKFALRLHAAQLPQLDWVSDAAFNLRASFP
ncbi:MAG: hypothetical protein NT011_00705 [Kiritimatiellaeota bacterium]|nr:hypothetical protein [Kiritimatiellota bacterium]